MKNGYAAALFGSMTLAIFGLIGVVASKDENLLGTAADATQLKGELASVKRDLLTKAKRVAEQDETLAKLQERLDRFAQDLASKEIEVVRLKTELTRCNPNDKTMQKSTKPDRK